MVRINLLPVRVSKKKEAGKQQLVLFAVLLAAGLVGNYLWSAARARELKASDAKLARTKEDIAQLERIIGEVKNLKEEQAELQKKLDVLDKLKQGRSGPVRMLDELATITPRQLWFTKMDEKGGTMQFQGTALTIDDVSELMTKLKQSKYFAKVELKKTAAVGGGKSERLVNFEISAAARYSPLAAEAADAPPGKKG
ncbi:MAG TPA: PilN domain-containing protein [Anaeromyxobacteraceae bacterium]|nr:PilN domain-containing protein [Anaeromyxobacteraceae bacterium]